MRIYGIGVDLVELKEFAQAFAIGGSEFISALLRDDELALLPNPESLTYLARVFATKEAILKAIGTGFSDQVSFTDLCLRDVMSATPTLAGNYQIESLMSALEIQSILVACSSNKNFAIASALALRSN